MNETFNCPGCGAPLETDGKETTIHCEYCGETVVVPQNLRASPAAGPAPAQVYIPGPTDQPGQPTSSRARMAPSQVRQMMMAIRSGQMDDAARAFQSGTGVSDAAARDTVGMIANAMGGSNRILPTQLAAMMMGAIAQSAGGFDPGYTYPSGPAYMPVPAARPRRRRGGFGCLVVLAALLVALYLGYTALSPQQIVSSLLSGNKDNTARQTAVAPIHSLETAIATAVSGGHTGGTGPALPLGGLNAGQGMVKGTSSPSLVNLGSNTTGNR